MNEKKETTAVARVGADIAISDDGRLRFANYAAVLDFTGQLVQAGMAPKNKTAQQCAISIVLGMQVGLPPLSALQNVAVINNMPCVWGDAADGLVKASGLEEWSDCTEQGTGEDFTVAYTTKRKGNKNPVTRTFGYRDAKAAGLWGKAGPWTQYPKRMMFHRARSWALRDLYADVLKGLRIAEEEMDRPVPIPPKDVKVSDPPYADGGEKQGKEQKPATAAGLIAAAAKPDAEVKRAKAAEPPAPPAPPAVDPSAAPDVDIPADGGKEPF